MTLHGRVIVAFGGFADGVGLANEKTALLTAASKMVSVHANYMFGHDVVIHGKQIAG